MGRLRLSFRVALRARWRTGLPLPVQQSRWLPSVVMGALLPTRQTAPCIKPQGGLSPPVQQSHKLPSDAVRVPPSVASLLLIQRRTGLPFRCSRPTAPFGRSVTPPSVISSCAARSVADGAPTSDAAEPLAPFGHNGSPSSDASNCALHQAKKGDSPLRCSRAAAPFGRSESPSISRISLLFSIGRGSPSGAADPRLPSVAV